VVRQCNPKALGTLTNPEGERKMPQTLTPDFDLLDRGVGIADLIAGPTVATDTDLEFRNDGNMVLAVSNQDAAGITATLVATPDPYGRGGSSVNDEVISIAAGAVGLFPFMALAMFQTGGSTSTSVTLSATANVTLTLIRLTKSL
jgi:hypothetical protein